MAAYDFFGNLTGEPLAAVEEFHEGDFVKIFAYEHEGAFFCGFQLRLGRLASRKDACVYGEGFPSKEKALAAARKAVIASVVAYNRRLVKELAKFDIACYNQMELF